MFCDEKKKNLHDKGGEQVMKGNGAVGRMDFPKDIFDMLFAKGRVQRERRGETFVHQLSVILEDFYSSATKRLVLCSLWQHTH